ATMTLRGWGNGLAGAGLILVVGVAVAQAPQGNREYWIVLTVSVVCALLAIALLRPKASEEAGRRLSYLRAQTTDRDIAFLRAGARAITFPETLSEHSVALAPACEKWQPEGKGKARVRADRLVLLGLMEQRGSSEVETSTLG